MNICSLGLQFSSEAYNPGNRHEKFCFYLLASGMQGNLNTI